MKPRPDREENIVFAEREVQTEGRHLEMAGVDVQENSSLEHRQQRGPYQTTEIEEEIGAADNFEQIRTGPSEELAAIEGLEVDVSLGVPIKHQDGALAL
jgi:hypothetical protein